MLPAMSCSRRRSCCNDPDSFCYICGVYILKERKRSITNFVHKVYRAYFGVKLGDQDKPWAPHVVCKSCVEHLRMWTKGKTKSFRFGVPTAWREQKNHFDDCYFCVVDLKGFNPFRSYVASEATLVFSPIGLMSPLRRQGLF